MRLRVVSSKNSNYSSLCSHTRASSQIWNPLTEEMAGSLGGSALKDYGKCLPPQFLQSLPEGPMTIYLDACLLWGGLLGTESELTLRPRD